MSNDDSHRSGSDSSRFSRRSVLKASAIGGAGLLTGGAVSNGAAADSGVDVDPSFANVRVREAMQAWDRGYRGRSDRTLALTDSGTDARHPDLGPWNGVTVRTDVEESTFELEGEYADDPMGAVEDAGVPQLVGWHNEHDQYGAYSEPRDDNGHGTHVASIMAGSGRASAIDTDRYEIDEPHSLLLFGDVLSYEIEAEADTGVFVSAYGAAIEVAIEGPDGRELDRTGGVLTGSGDLSYENVIAEAPTVHDEGEATYTAYVRGTEGQLLSVGRAERVAVGAFCTPAETVGDVTDGGDPTIHAGVAPGYSILSLTDLATATETFGEFAEEFTTTFNVRALNMSWGYVGGLPLGALGGTIDDIPASIRQVADAGVLPVAAAGNDGTPANGNGAPAVANEAISVVATGPRDGIAAYSAGGIGGIDDETGEPYMKPDLTAPGGQITDGDVAAAAGEPEDDVVVEESDDGAEADLEPVASVEELDRDALEPRTAFGDDLTGELDYDLELAGEIRETLRDLDLGSVDRLEPSEAGLPEEFGDVRDYTGLAGTSMAAPSVAGIAGLVADAMEADAPDPIALPEPAEAGREDTLRLKSTLLATATETALTAAPYHRAKVPVYTHGGRDPFEGYGRVNLGPAIDAVTRDLTDERVAGAPGLGVPDDERAVAGYVRVDEPGEITAEVEFSHYSGGNAAATMGDPHVDLFLYDAQNPDERTGDPTVVDSAIGVDGEAAVTTPVSETDLEENGGERVCYVVAKLVNVPGVVTGFDVQAQLELETAFERSEDDEDDDEELAVDASREGDGAVFTGGSTNRFELDCEVVAGDDPVIVRDRVPAEWDVDEAFGDVEATTPEFYGGKYVYFGLEEPGKEYESLTYFAESPDDLDESGTHTFGPIEVTTDTGDGTLTDREWIEVDGTDETVSTVGIDL